MTALADGVGAAWLRLLTAAAGALLLAACGSPQPAEDLPPPSPILYELAGADGVVEGWLFGTIHTLPSGLDWRTPAMERAVEAADTLMVEVADLDRPEAILATFAAMGASRGLPPILQRVSAAERAALERTIAGARMQPQDFDTTETWAAALILSRAASTGGPGVDQALIEEFQGEIVELEGAAAQFAVFDTLPQRDQRALLMAVVEESAKGAERARERALAWRSGDINAVERYGSEGLLADPALREVLLTRRNRQWAERIETAMARPGKLLVAVGAAHIAGEEGLPALLQERGFALRRVQ